MDHLNLKVTINKDGSVTASWDSIPNVIWYNAEMHILGASYSIFNEQKINKTSVTSEPNQKANEQYKITVSAYRNVADGGNVSEVKQILIPYDFYDNVPLTVPQNVKATADTVSVTVSFDEVAHARSYDILFDGTVYNVTATQKIFTGLQPKTNHTYAVRAKSTNQTGAYSTTKSIMTLPLTLAIPSAIQKTATENSATISWGAVSGATVYDLVFNGTTYNVSGTSKTFMGLTPAKGYSFKIRSRNADASSNYTSVLTVTTAPKPPSTISATSTENSVTVNWNAVTGATGYIIRFNDRDVHTIQPSNKFTGLKPKTAYAYQICSKSADGCSSYSSKRTVNTLAETPPTPSGDSRTSTENSVTLSWGAVPGATGYDVLFNGTVYPVTGTSKTISGLSPNTNYSYQIRSKNADGVSAYGPVQTVKTTSKAPADASGTTNENSVTVSWGAVPGAKSYDVLINDKVYNTTGTSKTIDGLSPNTSYSYQVRVNNENGSSSYSAAKTVKTSPTHPVSPKGTVSKNSVTLSWNSVSGATSYDVLFDGKTYRVTGTSKTISGLTPGTSYKYSVRSNNSGGSSSYSPEQTITTTANPPAMPTNVKATATKDSVTVSWNAVSGATSYDVSFDGGIYNTTGTSKTITGLAPGTSYRYAVRANSSGGSSSYTSSNTIKTLVGPPAVPANISATTQNNTVTVNWSSSAGATGYDVLFNGVVYGVNNSYSRSKTFSGLSYNTNYTYAVRAKNSAGTSPYSSNRTIRTPIAPPAVPGNISATATTDSATVSWGAVSGATSYDVSFGGTVYRVTSTVKTVTGLIPGTDYSYGVRANNSGSSSSYSKFNTIKTLTTIPAKPTNVTAEAKAHTVTVSWNTAHMATDYDVLFDGEIYNISGNTLQFTSLAANTDHTYRVRANNEHGSSDFSAEKTVRTLLDTPEDIHVDAGIYSMEISWGYVVGATGYDISFNGESYHVTEPFIEFQDLLAETGYDFVIRAKNELVDSAYTPVMRSFTRRAVPLTPSNVKACSTLTTVTISWNPVYGADDYTVRFDGREYQIYAETKRAAFRAVNKSGPHKIIFDLEPGTEHTYCVNSSNESGSSDFSTLQLITTQISNENGLPVHNLDKTYLDGRLPYMGLDPVNAMTGAFLWSYTYLQDFGKDGLHFTVMYDSKRERSPKVLGRKWTYSWNYLLSMDDRYAYFATPYDEVIPFRINKGNGSFDTVEGSQQDYAMGRMEEDSYFVRSLDGTEYIFNSSLCLSRIMVNGITACQFRANDSGQITRIEGRYGASLVFTYQDGHMASAADAMGNTVVFTYNNGFLASVANPEGSGINFTYDENGNLLEITDFSGKGSLVNEYDEYSRVVSQNTAGRGSSQVTYDEENGVTVFTDELGNETTYHYDENLHVTGIETALAGIQYEYNEKGQLTKQTDALSNSTQMEYDEYGRMNSVTYPDGTVEQVFYNDRNYPTLLINRDKAESQFEYDGNNNLILARDERGNESAYTYNDKDDLVSYKDKNGNTWTYTYDDSHHLEQAVDPEGNIYRYTHDALGRMVSYTTPTGNTVAYHYSAAGDLTSIVDGDGTVAFEYDKNGNKTSVVDRLGNRQRLEYNEMGQVSLATDFMGNAFTFTYDERGKLVSETDPLGYSQSYVYDALGNQISRTDKNGNTSSHVFNAANQLTEVKDAAGNLIRYTYDTMGQVRTVTDAMDHQTDYSYDAMGRLTEMTNALGYRISYTYDAAGNLLTKTDENGEVTEYAYNEENRPIYIKSGLGTTSFTYDKLGRITAVQDTEGHSEAVQYDGVGNVTAYVNKESHKTTYVYDKTGRLAEETEPNGARTSYSYDANGNCIKITDTEGSEYRYAYDGNGRMNKMTDPLGYETSYEYDAAGNLKSVTDAGGGKTTYEYDGNGNLVREVNPLGWETHYTYDRLNRLTEILDGDGNKSSYAYDANGNRTSYTDANRNEWTYGYDAIDRLTSITDQNGGSLTMEYTKTGKIDKVVDQEGAQTLYEYDALGRLIKMSDALENCLGFTYDSLGRMLTQTDANGNTTEYTYSPAGNLLSVKDPEGNTVAYTYNALGQVLDETDALGNVRAYVYDALGRTASITDAMSGQISFTYTARGEIATVTDACGGITRYQYDGCGNLTQVTDPLGNCTSFSYDAMNNQIRECLSGDGEQSCITIYHYDKKGRVVRIINPVLDERTFTYDAAGNLINIQDEDGNETAVRYDLNNRPVSMHYSDGREAAFRYNKRGELVELSDWNGTTGMEYGKTGKLARVTDHNGRTTSYQYDADGNTVGITYPDDSKVSYTYDKNNRMTKVTDPEGKTTQYAYDPAGNLITLRQPGSTSLFTYDANGQPLKVQYQFDDGTAMEHSFSYDLMGRIKETIKTGSTLELTGNAAYTYDALGRLLTCREGQDTEAYSYDSLGNRISKKVNGVEKATYQYNAQNQLTACTENGNNFSFSYDRCGNLTEEKRGGSLVRQYLYDTAGHMRQAKDLESGEKSEYTYNGLYMRIKNVQTLKDRTGAYRLHADNAAQKSLVTKETSYVTDFLSGTNNDLMAYEKGFGTIRTTFGRGYERLNQKFTLDTESPHTVRESLASKNGGKTYFQSDLSGSPLFAANEQGDVLRYAQRNAWGNLRLQVPDMNAMGVAEGLRFTGFNYDSVAGAHFAQARFYHAGHGRMFSKDPVKRRLNGYPYCENDPVNYVDPTGEILNILISGGLGALIEGGIGFAESAYSQYKSGQKFDARKAWGAAAHRAVTGAVRGAMAGSGAGLALSLLTNFTAGMVGDALEQKISTGSVNMKDSVQDGFTNAISSLIYGKNPFKSAWSSFGRGAGAGGAAAAIDYLFHMGDDKDNNRGWGNSGQGDRYGAYVYGDGRDPRSLCGLPSPVSGMSGYNRGRGYQYQVTGTSGKSRKGGFDLGDFIKATATGLVTGGVAGLGFYGAGKVASALSGSIRNIRANKGGSEIYYRTMSQGDYDYLRMTGELPSTGETFISPTKSFSNNYDGVMAQLKVNKGTTKLLTEIGVSNNTSQSVKDFGRLPQVQSGWNVNNVFFKGEGIQTNIGLGQGRGLEIFNRNLIEYVKTGGK